MADGKPGIMHEVKAIALPSILITTGMLALYHRGNLDFLSFLFAGPSKAGLSNPAPPK